jgi:hypothetical protein
VRFDLATALASRFPQFPWRFVTAGATGLVLIVGLLFSMMRDGASRDDVLAASLGIASIAAESAPVTPRPAQLPAAEPGRVEPLSKAPVTTASIASRPAPASPAAAQAALVLTLSTHRPCWVRMEVDAGAPRERLLPPDTTITLTVEQQASLRIGDAAAVTMQINNRRTKPLGREGRAVDLVITPSNFRTYLSDGA